MIDVQELKEPLHNGKRLQFKELYDAPKEKGTAKEPRSDSNAAVIRFLTR